MSREIKFRAWELLENKMYYQVRCGGMFDNIPTAPTTWINNDWVNLIGGTHTKVMQYTNLKDKNGVEIWEGDILRRNNNNKDLVQVKFGEFPVYEIETEEVVDKAHGWYLEVVIADELSKLAPFCYPAPLNKYWIDKLEIEVIGNIYEDKLEG